MTDEAARLALADKIARNYRKNASPDGYQVSLTLDDLNLLGVALRAQSLGTQEPVAHVLNEWADLSSTALQWLKNIKAGISTPDEALENMRPQYDRILALSRAASPLALVAQREALELLQLQQRGRARALRLLDAARATSDPITLAQADAYEECGNELCTALKATPATGGETER